MSFEPITYAMAKAYSDSKGGTGAGLTKFYVRLYRGTNMANYVNGEVEVGFY